MKRMRQTLFPLLLAMILIVGLSQTAFAAEVTGTVTYNGSKVDVSDNASKMQETLGSMVPGDSVDIVFSMKNTSKKTTDWYVMEDIAKAFEEGAASTGGAYQYELYYKDADGNKNVIYSNDTVGGDGTDADDAPVGLEQATNNTDEYFYLDRLKAGETGTFGMQIAIEGETHNNDYQQTLASVEANFAVQEVDTGSTSNASTSASSAATTTPRTGDQTKLAVYIALFAAAGILLIIIVTYMLVQRRKGGSHA